ncbi:nitric oxide reductase activation protein NorD [Desulfospira joergensenii]|uniref:nitric oxide reductase activation protein NorD n=1 Tax=Desulfospira joergensenii TaxID=53329 RepID=UPI0003B4C83F|nr:VWA domain-containing protein [Desulfospira joergensenii]
MISQDKAQRQIRMSRSGEKTFNAAMRSVSHLRPQTAAKFLAGVEKEIKAIEKTKDKTVILSEAEMLCRLNWSLVLPFFTAVVKIPSDINLILKWTRIAVHLTTYDIDAAITFFNRTPEAVKNFDAPQDLITWGQQGLEAFKTAIDKKRLRKAVNAYFVESSDANCGYPLERWRSFLDQAIRISMTSVDAALGFIQQGNQACSLLSENQTISWVNRGIEECTSEKERINYFNGTSLRAKQTSDILIPGVALKNKRNILSIICEALTGKPVKLRSNASLLGCKGFTGAAATDGRNIYLPEMASSFELFKLMALHQAMILQGDSYVSVDGTTISDPVQIHLDADERLIKQLPGLALEMKKLSDDFKIDRDSNRLGRKAPTTKPWWGDILFDLMKETDETISWVKEKAIEEYEDIPPELLEGLLESLIAGGEGEPDALWKLLSEMLDQIEFTSPDPEELQETVRIFFYKEWDREIADYKLEWCQVRQRIARENPNTFVLETQERLRGIIRLIRKQFMKLKPETFRKYREQPTGDSLDLDALVKALTDMRSGAGMSENVYIRRDKRIRDVSAFFLVDLSGSTGEEINGRRVIDIQKEAMAIMAEALEALGDPYAIYGFSTEGRFRVDLFRVKNFKDPYDETVQYRLGNLEPHGLTRMGAVVRHATHKLEEVTTAVKILVILTDGRPYDLEYGHLEYAISDTKKAFQEARSKNIHPFIITSDQKGSDYLRMISPQTESIVLQKIELLPTLLPALYRRLTV